MTEIKKLVIKATIANDGKPSTDGKESNASSGFNQANVPSYESLEERLSDLKVELLEMVERKIDQYQRKNNKH